MSAGESSHSGQPTHDSPPSPDDALSSHLSSLNLAADSLSSRVEEPTTPFHAILHPSATPSGLHPPSNAAFSDPSSPIPPSRQKRTAVIFQPACAQHRYVRNQDFGTIVERPERLRAIKTGVSAVWARLEEKSGGERWTGSKQVEDKLEDGDELGDLLAGLSIGSGTTQGRSSMQNVVGGAFDILSSSAILAVDDPAVRLVHPSPNHAPEGEADALWLAYSSPVLPPSVANPATPSRQTRAASSSPVKPLLPTTPARPSAAPPSWPVQLTNLCRRAPSAVLVSPFSEIPPHLPQGDLYLAKESEQAIFGALGAVCEGVDRVVEGEYDRAFVAIRPPGHHCGEANPQGFCFVNNVSVAAAHAYVAHGINRVIILDIDLHHGNGTQEIVWRINSEAQKLPQERQRTAQTPSSSPRKSTSPRKAAVPLPSAPSADPLRIMYGSLHDIWSYPCEEGDASLVSAASLVVAGGHGQHISNVHLEPYDDEGDFHRRLYEGYREGLLGAAERFCRQSAGGVGQEEEDAKRTLVIVSAGFDASSHEYPSMSRHARHVPTSFYRRFATDVVAFSAAHCGGKVLSVLEGGYSDRALASASGAWLTGLVGAQVGSEGREQEEGGRAKEREKKENAWWDESNLVKLEKACSVAKPRRGAGGGGGSGLSTLVGAPVSSSSQPGSKLSKPTKQDDLWLTRAVEIFAHIEPSHALPPLPSLPLATSVPKEEPKPMQLRARKVRHDYAGLDDGSTAGGGGGGRRTVSNPAPPPPPRANETLPPHAPAVAALPPLPHSIPFLPPIPTVASSVALPPLDPPPLPAPSSAAATTTTTTTTLDAASTAPSKPKVKFTWKQGGFGAETRM